MKRTARCSCGALQLTLVGEPQFTLACNCTNCQRRTGAAFGVGAYFDVDAIALAQGASREFSHLSDSQRRLRRKFCPECGTTVYWYTELFPGQVGVAAGCFTESTLPEPTMAVWQKSKMDWVSFPEHWVHLPEQGAA